jgi:ankyrin repeat protein
MTDTIDYAALGFVPTPPRVPPPALWYAALLGDVPRSRELIDTGANVHEEGVFIVDMPWTHPSMLHKTTPIQEACLNKRLQIVEILLESGADVSATGETGTPPLCYAARTGCVQSVQLLLRYNADVHSTNNDGCTALHLATIYGGDGYPDVVRVLIEHGADVLAQDEYGFTPFSRSKANTPTWALLKKEVVTRDKCFAFAMGHHKRLGVGSMIANLDPELLRMLLKFV